MDGIANERTLAQVQSWLVPLHQGGIAGAELVAWAPRVVIGLLAEQCGAWNSGALVEILGGAAPAMSLRDALVRLGTNAASPVRDWLSAPLAEVCWPGDALSAVQRCAELGTADVAWLGVVHQIAMSPEVRLRSGAHYTGPDVIEQVLELVLLRALREDVEAARGSETSLRALLDRLQRVRVFDPACGCGDFLLSAFDALSQMETTLRSHCRQLALELPADPAVGLGHVSGIELDFESAQLCRVGLWWRAGRPRAERGSPSVVCGDALRMDWRQTMVLGEDSIIVGNPPYVGKKRRSSDQSAALMDVLKGVPGGGVLDYAAGWVVLAGRFVGGTAARVGFVLTNSLVQGEQAGVLWQALQGSGAALDFARKSFVWHGATPKSAQVHVVLLGLCDQQRARNLIVDEAGEAQSPVPINPYLIRAQGGAVARRSVALGTAPVARFGSMPNDGGHLLLNERETEQLIGEAPEAAEWVRPLIGARSLLHNTRRWCLWLDGLESLQWSSCRPVAERVAACAAYRRNSARRATARMAAEPHRFGEIRQAPDGCLVVPRHTSFRRSWIPVVWAPESSIVHDSCVAVHTTESWVFGVLQSRLHMTWVRAVAGRLKSDLRYSIQQVYNTFPWLPLSSDEQNTIAEAARELLGIRARISGQSLAQMLALPSKTPELAAAHESLDRSVEQAFGCPGHLSEDRRLTHLFDLRDQLLALEKKKNSNI